MTQLAALPTTGIRREVCPVAETTFASRLKERREAAGLTQAALAERAGLHALTVAKLEQGLREPTWATVQALAKALGVRCTAFEDAGPAPPREPASRGRRRRRGKGKG
jgi:transcriptional regulator with XRE-family HTH domain